MAGRTGEGWSCPGTDHMMSTGVVLSAVLETPLSLLSGLRERERETRFSIEIFLPYNKTQGCVFLFMLMNGNASSEM